MKLIYNSIIPFSGYKAINLFGVLFVRRPYTMSKIDINHEQIHTKQMKELLYIFFYIWYFIEWIVLLFKYGDSHKAYRNIRFEKEAFTHENNLDYLRTRKHFNYLYQQ